MEAWDRRPKRATGIESCLRGLAQAKSITLPGFFSRFFGSPAARSDPGAATTAEATAYPGEETLEVVGESHYQDALWALVGGRRSAPVRHETYAILVPDPDNAYDPNAVAVKINGQLVGYLSRDDAARYRPGLVKLMDESANHLVALPAMIAGGGVRRGGIGSLGVFLDHDPADFGLEVSSQSHENLRTGFSEARATDLADDSYDLSWYAQLSDDDATAIGQLRSLLAAESDLIDRHYMQCELEHRLYRRRNDRASALDEFDAACEQHHREMLEIRPALVEKFGVVPVIEMYRQVTIRCEKAKLWQAARDWAERGIGVYGDDGARPEVVEDLRKRLDRAVAKIEAAERPLSRKPRGAPVATVTDRPAELESLVCAECGASFERVRTRGRKPRLCPTCRGQKESHA